MEGGKKYMDDDVIPFGQLITNTFKNIKCEDVKNASLVFDIWKKVLFSIKGIGNKNHPENPFEGQNLYEHSRIIDFKNGILLVEADHPGWIQLLQMHKQYILNGLNKASPDLHINTIAFRLKGRKGELFDAEQAKTSTEKVKAGIEERVEKEEALLGKVSSSPQEELSKPNEMPPELANLFDDLKKSVLTNSKK